MKADSNALLDFYTADTPNGLKVSIYLHEAGIAHRQIALDLSAGEQHRPDYRRINPNGKIPAIIDHDAGITLFESGAILSYLAAKTGVLQPASLTEQMQVQQWLHFQIGGIGPMLGQLWWFLHGSRTGNREATERYRKEAMRLYGVVEHRLLQSTFLATTEFSIADIAAYSWLRTWDELGLDISPFGRVRSWLDQIGKRRGVCDALDANRT
ncbi:glutathione S-transferase family protein [Herbaspirillum chlorophenolicum]|uniref:glutathione S-transferase family protein n=1 Tax=Herbaspirillum chlorophenolicum TaxID=211589 RepID=UPI00067CBAAB|nr:glutathione S-transferase N-terminal domain-containing protein [Herbaspirillum chlorophenolicum]